MKGICFIEPLFEKVYDESKTHTRRIALFSDNDLTEFEKAKYLAKSKYRVGETIYLKEPYIDDLTIETIYKYLNKGKDIYDIPSKMWKNKLFMPEKYARFSILIKNVRLERLQDISDEDCIKEGIFLIKECMYSNGVDDKGYFTPKDAYKALIDLINGKGTWDKNPYVYVYEFQK